MTETPKKNPWRHMAALLGFTLVAGLIWYFGPERLLALVQNAAKGPLVVMGLLILAGFWIRAWKWHYALGAGGHGIFLFFAAKTAGNWTPGRAGELAPLLHRRYRNARTAAWIALDRVVEVAWTLGLGILGAVAFGMIPVFLAGILALTAFAAGAGIWIWWRMGCKKPRSNIPVDTSGFPNETGSRRWSARTKALLGKLQEEVRLFGTKMPFVMVLTAVAKVSDIYAVILLCEAFGHEVSFLLVCAARCAHGLVSAIPLTPDSTGVPFAAAGWLLHEYGNMPGETLTAALGLEVLVINIILLVCFFAVSAVVRDEPA